MTESMYPQATKALAEKRRDLAPEIEAAFRQFSQATFRDGALPGKTKQLIAVAVAHVTQCPYCIKGHTRAALRDGATPEELMEAIWVAAEMRAPARPTPIRSSPSRRSKPRALARLPDEWTPPSERPMWSDRSCRLLKRAYDPPAPGDGRRVLVDRIWPRHRPGRPADRRLAQGAGASAGPKWFGHTIPTSGRVQGALRPGARASGRRAQLVQMAKAGRLTLVFGARDTEHNNAVALREYLERWREPEGCPAQKGLAGLERSVA